MAVDKDIPNNDSDCNEADYSSSSESECEPNVPKDISPDKNDSILKEILSEGKGYEKPKIGDKVEVHYVGRLEDDSIFDSSRERGEKFSFICGKGEVIKGWDIAIKTMKRGEIAKFIIKSQFAYGEVGSPPKIPPNSTLIFEIELFDWRLEDLTRKKDGGVRKQILVEGEGYSSPNEGSSVELRIIGRYQNKIFEERDVSFVYGEASEANIIDGVEIAVGKMKKGEKANVYIRKEYAWSNPPEEFGIPSNYDEIIYTVKLKGFEKLRELWEMDANERLEQAEIAKNKGSIFFKDSKLNLALKQYKRIIKNIGPPDNEDFDDKDKRDKLLLAGYLNLSLTHLKLGNVSEAVRNCNLALEMDSENEKGLFRRGQGYLLMKEYEKGAKDFEKVLELDPVNKAAKNSLIQCKQGIKIQKEEEKKMYKNMFSMFEKDASKDMKHINKDVWNELKDEHKRDFASGDNTEVQE